MTDEQFIELISNFTDEELSERCSVSLTTIERWRKGTSRPHQLVKDVIKLQLERRDQ